MRKTLTTIAIAVATGTALFAQQDAQFSHNMYNRLATNPGYAGMNDKLCGVLIGRNQWSGFSGQPNTVLLSADMPILQNALKGKLAGGLGLTVFNDQLGFDKTNYTKLAYSWHRQVGQSVGRIGIGIELGLMQKSLFGNWKAPNGDEGVIASGNDSHIPNARNGALTFDLGLGAYYRGENGLYVGISTTHLPQTSLKKTGSQLVFKNVRHYYVMAGWKKTVGGGAWDLVPSTLIKSDATATQVDLNMLVYRNFTSPSNQRVWGGLSYRVTDAVVALIGYEQSFSSKLVGRIGYSFDITMSKLNKYSSGSHEIMLGFCYNIIPPIVPTIYHDSRTLTR